MRAPTPLRLALIGALALIGGSLRSEWKVPGGGEEALECLDAFTGEGASSAVLGMTGFHGRPLPTQWLILTGNPGEASPRRETVVAGDRILGERVVEPLPGQDWPHLSLDSGSVKISAAAAFGIASGRARERDADFESVHYRLRVREDGSEPVWLLSLLDRAQRSVGQVSLSARDGRLLRETWVGPTESAPVPSRREIAL